jgi:hypothetical protein
LLNLVVREGGTADFATVKDVADVRFINSAGNSNLDVDAFDWSGIGKVGIGNGNGFLRLDVENLESNTGIYIDGNAGGRLDAFYNNDVRAWMYAGDKSKISFIDGNVVGSAVDTSASFSIEASADSTELTVGDISILSASNKGDWSYLGIYNDQDLAADINVGNINIEGFNWAGVYIYNTSHTDDSLAGNISVGDVNITTRNELSLDIYNTNYFDNQGSGGNLTVGNISLAMTADDPIWDMEVNIYNGGYNNVGDLTIGNVSLSIADSAYADFYLENEVYNDNYGDDAILGNTTIGNITLNLGKSSNIDFNVDISAETDAVPGNAGNAIIGDVSIGNIVANVGANSGVDIEISIDSYVSWDGNTSEIGNVTIGNITANLDSGAEFDLSLDVSASNFSGTNARVGNVSIGLIDLNMGVGSDSSISIDIESYGSADGTQIGLVSIEGLNANLIDGAYLNFDLSVESSGEIEGLNVGDIAVNAGISASADLYFDVNSYSRSIGEVVFGDINLNANNKNADIYMSVDVYASEDIGKIEFGDISVNANKSADVQLYGSYYADEGDISSINIGNISISANGDYADAYLTKYFTADDGDIGNVSVGNISLSANGDYADAYGWLEFYSWDGKVGNINVGNISIEASGEDAYAYLGISADADRSGGSNITVGNVSLSAGNGAELTDAYAELFLYSDYGSISVGNINATGKTFRTADDSTMDYNFYVSIDSDKNITVGNISVSGGDGLADNLGNLTSWLDLYSDNGTITVGNIDYSGWAVDRVDSTYKVGANIDVSDWLGAASITGSMWDDTIYDNKGTNVLRGGAGADTFVFTTENTGKTLATMDKILDFNATQGDLIDIGILVDVPEFTVQSNLSNFSAFVSAADSAKKDVFAGTIVGQSGVFLAIDHNGNDVVDYMIHLVGVSLSDVNIGIFA